MQPEELSRQLRQGTGRYPAYRPVVVILSIANIGSMALISLYQMGIIKHLPEPPLPYLQADQIDASAEAYEKLATPDAVLGMASYAATAVLAAMGGQDRARTRPWIPLALAAKVLFDAAQAGVLTVDQWVRHRAFCFWCLLAATATFAQVPLVLPEARAALRWIRGKSAGDAP